MRRCKVEDLLLEFPSGIRRMAGSESDSPVAAWMAGVAGIGAGGGEAGGAPVGGRNGARPGHFPA